jgi:hypothetical protein
MIFVALFALLVNAAVIRDFVAFKSVLDSLGSLQSIFRPRSHQPRHTGCSESPTCQQRAPPTRGG